MRLGRRAKGTALGMAVLLCLSNLTAGAGMDSGYERNVPASGGECTVSETSERHYAVGGAADGEYTLNTSDDEVCTVSEASENYGFEEPVALAGQGSAYAAASEEDGSLAQSSASGPEGNIAAGEGDIPNPVDEAEETGADGSGAGDGCVQGDAGADTDSLADGSGSEDGNSDSQEDGSGSEDGNSDSGSSPGGNAADGSEQGTSLPGGGESGGSEPGTSLPGGSESGGGVPDISLPSGGESGSSKPGTSLPGGGESGGSAPDISLPSGVESGGSEPGTSLPGGGESGGSETGNSNGETDGILIVDEGTGAGLITDDQSAGQGQTEDDAILAGPVEKNDQTSADLMGSMSGATGSGETEAGTAESEYGQTDRTQSDDPDSKDEGSAALVTEESETEESSLKEDDPGEGYSYDESMSLADLKLLPEDEAGAATEVTARLMASPRRMMLMASASGAGGLWSCSDYYVNEQDLHSVSKDGDFSLKIQIEFHTSTALNAGDVSIHVPEALMTDRLGRKVIPSQIGVPQGTREKYCESLNTPFNWYKDAVSGELVFFNYRPIASGTNTAFQILYHPVLIMEITDQTSWAVTPTVSVTLQDGTVQNKSMDELTGNIDSSAQILNVSANAFSDGTISCMPALYTKDQVARVLGSPVPAFLSGAEDEWLFLAWQIDSQGEFTQPWDLHMDAGLSSDGLTGAGDLCVVGSTTSVTGTEEGEGGTGGLVKKYVASQSGSTLADISSADLSSYVGQGMFHLTTVAVTAVRKSVLTDSESVLSLSPVITLTPKDGIDPVSTVKGSASWTYVDYTWKYQGDDVGIGAWTGERASDGSVSYSTHQADLPGWINEYRIARESQKCAGAVPMQIRSECRGYSYTHETAGTLAGTYITGTGYEVTTVDDVVYAISESGEEGSSGISLMDGRDYYYSSVSVSIRDRGMDIFEDRAVEPMSEDECAGADRSSVIYALYEDSSDWEMAAECPWNSSGKIAYTFTKEQLSRKPWRIKVVHNAADYDSTCVINSDLVIRPASPVMEEFLKNRKAGDGACVKVEHLGSVLARSSGGNGSGAGWFHDTSDTGADNYSEPGLSDLTKQLYGVISMRANSFAQLTELKKHAKALKTVSRENDPTAGAVRLTYTIGALEGYRIYSQSAADSIARGETAFPAPDRAEYVIYDLLPEGVIPDPSVPMKAGLVMGTQEKHLVTPSLWKGKDVSVHIDPMEGIISDWKHTGRTMVILNVSIALDEGQIPRMCDGMWMNGIGVQFGAYIPYRDLKRMKDMPNIAAVMPGTGRDDPAEQIIGMENEAACDDGVIVPYSDEVKKEFSDFGADIDSDGVTDKRCVLYAYALAQGDAAVSLTDGISLTVKADREEFTDEGKSAVVGAGDPYTYRIDVTNSSMQPISSIVIGEHLERGSEERAEAESGRTFDPETWQGFLDSVDTEDAARQGIQVKVYLSADDDAPLPDEGSEPDKILTGENGWIPLEEWNEDMAKARSVAVDLRLLSDGNEFILQQGDSVHIRLHLHAPLIGEGDGKTMAEHAYNCASFYSTSPDEPDGDLVTGDAVEVTLKERTVLIVEKELQNDVPTGNESEVFLFRLTRNSEALGLRPYRLEEKKEDAGEVSWADDGELHTTGREGYFSLKAGQRAVFENEPGGQELECEEIRSACYEADKKEEKTQEGQLCRFENTWHPTLYLTKKVYGAPEGEDLSEDVFRVRVMADSGSLAGMPYWTIDPDKGLVEDEVIGEHTVDEDSCVLIHAGEVIALHPGDAGCTFEVCEEDSCFGADSDYVAVSSQKSGVLGEESSSVVLENAWKWKDLILQKQVLHKDEVSGSDIFSFRLWKMKEGMDAEDFDPQDPDRTAEAAAGVSCRMDDVSFETDENGNFSCACAGKDVVIRHLEAKKIYVIQETQVPEFYEAVNGGIVSVRMPVLGDRKYAVITNSWKKRSLEISKSVLSGIYDRRTTVFTPQYPGFVEFQSQGTSLLDYQDSRLTGFRLEFPRTIELPLRTSLDVTTQGGSNERLTGTIEAGTVKTYTTSSLAQVELRERTKKDIEGFFFYFTPVFSNEGQSADGTDMSKKRFRFCLEVSDENGQMAAAANRPYTLSTGESLQTDENGAFELSDGTSAVFKDLGTEGTKWKVTETPDTSCPQVYPSGGRAAEGTLGESGEDMSHGLFINGNECQGMIRKKFYAAEGDASALSYIEDERGKGASSMLRSVFLIEIENDQGTFVPLNGEIDVADSAEGMLFRSAVKDGLLCLSENQTAIISGIPAGRKWKATEIGGGLAKQADTLYEAVCVSPGQDSPAGGTAGDAVAEVDFVNELRSVSIVSANLITKELRSGESGWEQVPEGAVLALCLERYEDGVWKKAGGVNWVQCLNGVPDGSAFHQTGDDGIIRVTKESVKRNTSTGEVYLLPIAVADGNVRTQLYYASHEAQEKDLRIRELPDLSDPSYGMLVGGGDHSFINENERQSLIVEKQTDVKTDQKFTMQIVQQIGDVSLPGSYLTYQIRDAKTLEAEGSGRTDEQGRFSIQGSQQAVFDLAEGSTWTITEKNSGGWKLSSCIVENRTLDPAETAGGVSFTILSIRDNVTLTSDMLCEDLRDPSTGQVLDLTAASVTIPHYVELDGQIMEITAIGESAFYESDLEQVKLAEGIREIQDAAFYDCEELTDIQLPQSLVKLGDYCFAGSSLVSLDIPSAVRTAGEGITSGCSCLEQVTIHQNEKNSPFNDYDWDAQESTNVVFIE